MPITEDASAPAAVTSTTNVATTGSFTPAANSLIIAIANAGNNTGAGTITCPVTDSLGSSWTLLKRSNTDPVNSAGSSEVWAMDAGSSPSARTVTATGTGGANAVGTSLCVKVLTGANPVASVLGASANPNGGNNYTIALTTTTAGSLVIGGLSRLTTNVTLTANGSTTAWQSVSDATNTETYGAWRAVNLTGTPGADTYGYTNTTAAAQVLVAVELLAGASTEVSRPSARPGKTWKRRFKHRQILAAAPVVAAAGAIGDGVVAQRSATESTGVKAISGAGMGAQHTSSAAAGSKQTAGVGAATQPAATGTTGAKNASGGAATTQATATASTGRKNATAAGIAAQRSVTSSTGLKNAAGAGRVEQGTTTQSTGSSTTVISGAGLAAQRASTASTGTKNASGAAATRVRTSTAGTGVHGGIGAGMAAVRTASRSIGIHQGTGTGLATARVSSLSTGVHRGTGTALTSSRNQLLATGAKAASGVARVPQRTTTISLGEQIAPYSPLIDPVTIPRSNAAAAAARSNVAVAAAVNSAGATIDSNQASAIPRPNLAEATP
jgi:hypothetical protein